MDIKRPFNLVEYSTNRVVKVVNIVAIGTSPIDAMHQRLICRIGFKAEGPVAVAMRLHLLSIEGLNLENHSFHFINHFLTKRAVIRQEVDHPHSARFAHVQIRQPLGRHNKAD